MMVSIVNETFKRDRERGDSTAHAHQATDGHTDSAEAVRLAALLPEVLKRYGLIDELKSPTESRSDHLRPVAFPVEGIVYVGGIFTT